MARNAWLIALLFAACSHSSSGEERSLGEQTAPLTAGGSYPLDGLRRTARRGQCPQVSLDEFGGEQLRFVPAARVAPAFRARLGELEGIAREVGVRIYGRAPSAILIAASYDCRAVSSRSGRLSEHAFGNAIDISGFRFARASWLAWFPDAFDVSVERHWKARGALESRHALFLGELTRTLIERDVFRTLLGPAHPNHRDHFHFDMAPSRYVHL